MYKIGRKVYFLLLTIGLANSQANFKTAADYTADRYITPDSISDPRSIIRDEFGDILVVSRGASQITAVYVDSDKTVKTTVIIDGKNLGLNHGLAYYSGHLYASTSSQVLRWVYNPGQRVKVTGTPEVVVKDIPNDGDHITRSLIVDRYNRLYVSVGSASDVAQSDSRSQIRRFNLAEGLIAGGYEYTNGEEFATGVRNAVGLAFDKENLLWGVDCGPDDLRREDFGGDIHNTNPADKLLRFDVPGKFYGYPYCWTVDELFGYSKGQQYAWPDYMNDTIHTDAWCQNSTNNRPSTLSLPAHNAALGLIFYDGVGCGSQTGSFPCSMTGDLFVALHGSFNRQPPSGYKVVRIPINHNTSLPTGEIEDIIFEADPSNCAPTSHFNATKCFRPVDVVFSPSGHLIVSSDTSSDIIRIYHKDSDDKFDFVSKVKKSLNVLAIIALSIVVIITAFLFVMITRRYFCQPSESDDVPYMKNHI